MHMHIHVDSAHTTHGPTYLEEGAGNGLDVHRELELGELVHELVQGLAHPRELDQLAQVLLSIFECVVDFVDVQ